MSGRRVLILALLVAACGRPVDTRWQEGKGYRWRALDVPGRGRAGGGFTLLDPSRTGISFINTVSESLLVRNRILAQGAGVCLGDVDGDGLVDIFLARTEGPNALYRNIGGWRFEDITERAGVAAPDRYSTGCAFADVDGNGHLDLLLAALGGPNALFLNDSTGGGRFTERGADAGLASSAGSTTIALADVDGDGDLDLYVTNYKAYTTLDRISPQERAFDQVVRQLGPPPPTNGSRCENGIAGTTSSSSARTWEASVSSSAPIPTSFTGTTAVAGSSGSRSPGIAGSWTSRAAR